MPSSIIRTPQGPIAVIPRIAQALVERGIVREENGQLHADSKDQINNLVGEDPELSVCDFCTAPKPTAVIEVADFDMGLGVPGVKNMSTSGWAACEPCRELVLTGKRDELLKRAIAGSSNPQHVMVQRAITDLHDRFWKAYKRPRLSEDGAQLAGTVAAVKEWLDGKGRGASRAHRHERIRTLARRLDIPVDMVQRIADMPDVQALADYVRSMEGRQDEFTKAIGKLNLEIAELQSIVDELPPDTPPAMQIAAQLAQHRQHVDAAVTFDKARPWMEAVEMQYAALADLDRMVHQTGFRSNEVPGDVRWSWQVDRSLLRRAECFTWAAEPLAACRSAARTIPHDTALRFDMLPTNQPGWWYFPGPIPIKTTSWDDGTIALLYGPGSEEGKQHPFVWFTTYVMGRDTEDGRLRHMPMGTQGWRWFEGETFHQMIARCGREYDEDAASVAWMQARGKARMPKDDMLKATADFGLFFLAACAWLHQRILSFDTGHIERHRRKQLVRERKLDQPPNDVKIIQLRRVERQPSIPPPVGKEPIDWSCRWTVDGHFRNQPCGKDRGERKLIWIMPFVKGPADKPLKVPAHKIYVVNR